jgi:hypothetical protein
MPRGHTIQVPAVSREELDHLRQRLSGSGITCEGDDPMTCSGRGIDASLSYEGESETLTVSLKAAPGIVTPGYLFGNLYDMLAAGPLPTA